MRATRGLPARQNGTTVAAHSGEDGLLVRFSFGEDGHDELVNVSDPGCAGADSEVVSDRQRGGGADLEYAVDAHKPHPFNLSVMVADPRGG